MTAKSFPALVDSLIAQRLLCRGDDCRRKRCRRCLRGEEYSSRQRYGGAA